jgi:two-component system, LytTR family, sensor kinase
MYKKHIYWILQISGWTLYASINVFFIIIGSRPILFEAIFGFFLLGIFFIGSTHYFRKYIKKNGWIKLEITRLIPRVLAAVVSLSFFYVLFELVLIQIFDQFYFENTLIAILMNFSAAVILYIGWSMLYFLYHYIDSYNKALKYEATINEIELNKLKSQLNPHFIFNALNSIRALVDENPLKAKNAITQLSHILRNSLIVDKNKIISFDEEIKTVRDYLDLEMIRYEERLRAELDIQPGSGDFQVPPLMIQTLVENGIKHGTSKLKNGGLIKIETCVDNSMLVIRIRNSGQYINLEKQSGYGISNTVQRLKLIYGDNAHFKIINEDNNFVLTEIKIPKHI